MITKITVRNFKSLREIENLELSRVNLLIGTNASGKSNFLEVLRFLQGLGNELPVQEILNGKPKGATQEAWNGLRGGATAVPFSGGGEMVTAIECTLAAYDDAHYDYGIWFEAVSGKIRREYLRRNGVMVFQTDVPPGHDEEVQVTWYGPDGQTPTDSCPLEFQSKPNGSTLGRSALSLTMDRDRPSYPVGPRSSAVMAVLRVFSNQQCFEPRTNVLREFSSDQPVRRMGERGEEFAALVKGLMQHDETRCDYVSWLKELTPSEVDDVEVITTPDREVRFAIRRPGRPRPESAKVLSDGTLRFAALSAAFFQPDMPRILLLEEVETHLHPARIRLVAELLLNQSKQTGTQVFATTHSPKVVDWLLAFKDEALRVLHFYRNEESGATLIRPLSSLVKSERTSEMAPVGDLMADGWMEVPA